MSRVAVVTDSSACIPLEMMQGFPIFTIPLHIHWGKFAYRDGIDLHPSEFYAHLQNAHDYPTTSQPSPQAFRELYTRLLEEGHEIISLHISANLSGTLNSALQARSMLPGAPIEVIDSRTAAMGLGFQVLNAAQAARQGASLQECKALAGHAIQRTGVYFVLDTLDYLQRGGRIGSAAATLGKLMDLKPILQIKDGVVQAAERVRSLRKALDRLLQLVEHQVSGKGCAQLAALYFASRDEAAALLEKARQRFSLYDDRRALCAPVSPVIGAHTGPYGVGLAFIENM